MNHQKVYENIIKKAKISLESKFRISEGLKKYWKEIKS